MRFRSLVRLLAPAIVAARAGAQASTAIPPVRPLGSIIATSKDPLGAVAQIRVLSDGRVLANDAQDKRVVLFDASLAHFARVIDTTSETARAYGGRGGALFSFTGDTSFFGDVESLSMRVIDPTGKIARVIAAPRGLGGGLVYMNDLLRQDEVIGVEVYLDYHDVPAEWRVDAFPDDIYLRAPPGQGSYCVGHVGLPKYKPSPRRG